MRNNDRVCAKMINETESVDNIMKSKYKYVAISLKPTYTISVSKSISLI